MISQLGARPELFVSCFKALHIKSESRARYLLQEVFLRAA